MNFEHFEGAIRPDEQFDRLGKKEDTYFLTENLTEDLENKIKETQIKIANLKELIRTHGDDEERDPVSFLETKNFELKEAEAELKVLQAQGQRKNNREQTRDALEKSLNPEVFQN